MDEQPAIGGANARNSIHRLGEFLKEFSNESDRAFVVISIAKVDILLEQLLLARLLPNPSGQDPLFDGDAPLATFSAKINLSYRLAIIGPDLARSLHMLRKIRNAFAHEVSGCDLNQPPHCDRIDSLVHPMRGSFLFEVPDDPHELTSSDKFRRMLAIVIFGLEGMLELMTAIESPRLTLDSLANVKIGP